MAIVKDWKEVVDLLMVLETVTRNNNMLHQHASDAYEKGLKLLKDLETCNPYERCNELLQVNRELACECAGLRSRIKKEKRKVVEL